MQKGPQTGARAMVEALDSNSLVDGDLTALTLPGSNDQLITSDLDSLVSIQAELDRYNTTEVDIGAEGDTLCVTIPSSENIDMNAMEIGDSKEIIIPECETQLVEYTEDIDMNEVDITTSVVEETPAPVMIETIPDNKIVHVQPSQQPISHASPIIVSGAPNTGQPSQSFVVIQSAPGSRVISTNPANQAKKPGQLVGRITGLSAGSIPQFQSMSQAIVSARAGAGNVVQLKPIANSTPVQRPLAAKGQTLTVSNVGARMIQPQTSTPSRVTKVLLPRQAQGAGGSVQHLVAIPVQKSGQENQQGTGTATGTATGTEQVVQVGNHTLRIVSQKKVGEAVESATALSPITGQQTIKANPENVQIVQAGQATSKPVQVARTVNPFGNQIVNITLQQAQQMGLLSPGKVQQILPQGRGIIVNKTSQGGTVVLQSNVVKSPTKILPAPAGVSGTGNVTLATGSSPSIRPLSLSPSKVIITRQAPGKAGSLLTTSTGQVIRLPVAAQTVTTATSTGSVQPMTVSGRTMQYVRLVSIPSSSNTTTTLTSAPRPKATSVLTLASPGAQGQIKMIPVPIAAVPPGQRPVLPKSLLARTVTTGVPLSQASGSPVATTATATQIADRGMGNIVVLPPTFLQQVRPQTAQVQQQQQQPQPPSQQQQQVQHKQQQHTQQIIQIKQEAQQQLLQIAQEQHRTITAEELLQLKTDEDSEADEDLDTEHEIDLPPYEDEESPPHLQTHSLLLGKSPPMMNAKLLTDAVLTPASPIKPSSSSRTPAEPNGIRPRKPCNCTKSQCLKMYCDCFANGEFCHMCNCNCCFNNLDHEEDRQRAIRAVLERNPHAFRPKIGKGQVGDGRRHNKGCNCRRSGCLKNYCECYEAKIACSNNCKCVGCRNVEDMGEAAARDFRELTNPGDLRLNPITAISKKRQFSSLTDSGLRPLQDSSINGFRQPFNFVTQDVVEATLHCLWAQGEKAEKMEVSDEVAERLLIEEFGRCLVQIIECANRTDDMVT